MSSSMKTGVILWMVSKVTASSKINLESCHFTGWRTSPATGMCRDIFNRMGPSRRLLIWAFESCIPLWHLTLIWSFSSWYYTYSQATLFIIPCCLISWTPNRRGKRYLTTGRQKGHWNAVRSFKILFLCVCSGFLVHFSSHFEFILGWLQLLVIFYLRSQKWLVTVISTYFSQKYGDQCISFIAFSFFLMSCTHCTIN